MEANESVPGLSIAAMVAIACNALVGFLLFLLFLVLYKACKVPSSQERLAVLAPTTTLQTEQRSEQKYLLTS